MNTANPSETAFAWLLAFVGAGFLAYSVRDLVLGLRTRLWPCLPGVVLVAEVVTTRNGRHGPSFRPRVRYSYQVADRTFESERIAFALLDSRRYAEAERCIGSLHTGSAIPVYVNPSRPDVSVLVSGLTHNNWHLLLIGVILIGGSVAILFSSYR